MPPKRPSPVSLPAPAQPAVRSAPALAEVDALLDELRTVAPQVLDCRVIQQDDGEGRNFAYMEAVITRGSKRHRYMFANNADRSPAIGRDLGLPRAQARQVQRILYNLGQLNPYGCWMLLPQEYPAEQAWDRERIKNEAAVPERLCEVINDLRVDSPGIDRIDAMTRTEGTAHGFIRTRSFLRIVGHGERELATIDLAYVPRMIESIMFGDPDELGRNIERAEFTAKQLGVSVPILADILHDLTLPFTYVTRMKRLQIAVTA